MKLHYKFFTLFTLNSAFVMVLLVGALRIFVYQNFTAYVNRIELGKLNHLVAALEQARLTEGGWDVLRTDPRHWHNMVFFSLMKDHPKPVPAERRPEGSAGPDRRPPPEHDEAPGPPRSDPPVDPLQIGRRLSLFGADMRHVAGRKPHNENQTLREIRVNGKTAGWLALDVPEKIYHPLALGYLKSQNHAVYVIAAGITAFSILLSFLISRQLLRPVRELTKGTAALTSFRFDTTIKVRAKDELGKLAADFNHMAKTLKKSEEMRQQWISDISHELRTPLTIMRGRIEAVLDGVREMGEDTMTALHSDVIRLNKLVDDLHLLSLSDSRNIHIKKALLNPLRILGETIDHFRPMLERHDIRLQANMAMEEQIIVEGDGDHLTRLFSNLLENTIRYTDAPGLLKIDAFLRENRLTIRFEDSGPGVPDDALERIFDRLYRVDKSRSRKLGGSGLGLSICKQIAESHNGRVRANHSPSGGLRITVAFPLFSPEK